MDPTKARQLSRLQAAELGHQVHDGLPLFDPFDQHCRSLEEVTDRLLCLHILVACSFGYSIDQGRTLLIHHNLKKSLTHREEAYLDTESDAHQCPRLQCQVESLWTLAWCLNVHDDLDFVQACRSDFVLMLPNLRDSSTDMKEFREKLSLRSPEEILACADLAYCLHWSVRDAQLHKRSIPSRVHAGVIGERRRALEWVVSSLAWDDISLDT